MSRRINEIIISRTQAQALLRDLKPTDETLLAIRDAIVGRTMSPGEFIIRVVKA